MKLILSSAVVLLSTVAKAQDFIPLCGDCWCIPDNEEGTCANKTEGIYQVGDFPEDLAVLTTFQLAEEITLQSSDGGDCSPFAPIGNDGNYNDFEYPEGFDPPCEKNPSQQGEVCGFKFIEGENDDTCNNREYTLQSYADDDAAEADGAVVMHRNGACGVCSTAQDIYARMDTLEGFESRTVVCATAWLGSRNFGNLVDCFTGMGFTQGCSTLWAHYTLLNALLCAAVCLPDSSTNLVKLIEGPDCAYTNCVKCAAEDYPLNEILDDLSGHTVLGGAIVDRKPLPCSEYTPLVYDPCGGTPYVPEDNQGNNQDNNQGNQGGDDSGVMNAALSRFVIALVGVVAFAIF